MNDADRQGLQTRVLLLAPTVKDGELTQTIFARAGIVCRACPDQLRLCDELTAGAGAVVIAEEAVHGGAGGLAGWLARQPTWSDMPVLVLARAGADSAAVSRAMEELGNVTVLERPTRIAALVSAVRTALRARQRQYQLRDELVQRERSALQLDMAMAAAHAGSWQIDLTSGEFSASDRAIELHGLPPGTPLTQERALACVHPDDRAGMQSALQRTIESGQPFQHEHRVLAPGGPVRWVSAHAERRGEGVQACVVGHVQDITARKHAEASLRYSEQLHRIAFEQSPTGMAYVGPDGRFIKVNQAMCEIAGRAAEALVGMKVWDLAHPDDQARDAELLAPFLRGDTPFYQNEKRYLRKDGGVRWVAVTASMVTDAEGRPLHTVSVIRDITALKASESVLREAQDQFVTLANTAPAMLWVTKADARLEFISRGWLDHTGQTEAEAFGDGGFGWLAAVHPDDRERSAQVFLDANQKQEPFALDHRIRRADGAYRWAHDAGRPRIDADGQFLGYVGSVIDMHDRQLANERLQQSEARLRRVFESNVTGMIRWDLDRGLIIDANAEFLRMTGYAPEDLAGGGLNFRTLTPPEWTDRNEASIQSLRTRGVADAYEKEYFRKDGSRVPVLIAGTRFEDSPSEGMSIVVDIADRKRAEAERESAQTTLTTVVEQCPFGIYIVDDQFRLVRVNAASEDAAFVNVRPLIGRPFDEVLRIIWPEPVAADIIAIFRHTLATGEAYRSKDFINLRADIDQTESYEWEVHPIALAGGRRGAVCYYFDATNLRQAETEVRAGEQRMRLATEAAALGIHTYDVRTGRIEWDARVRALWGVSTDEPIGYDTFLGGLHPDDRAPTQAAVDKAIDPAGDGRYAADYRVVNRSDGVVRWVASTGLVYFEAGQPVRMFGTVQDITDRRLAEAALRDSEARLSGILRQSPAGIVQTDATGRMTLVNPRWCEMMGHPESELLGRNIVDITHPLFVAETAAAFGRLAAGGPDFQIEKAYSRKDGSTLRAQSNVAAIRSPDGEFLGLIAVILDISERLRSEEELRRLAAELTEADRRKDVFLATLAHELRSPLAPISNGLQLMKLKSHNGEAFEQLRAMMDRQLSQLVRLVDDLLDVSRITQGKMELRKERIDLKAVIEAALETSRPVIEQAGHELSVVVADESIFVHGDATRLAQVVSNLLNNAAKYTPRGGHVRLTAGREDGTAVVLVKDNGIGIPRDMIDSVFEMFTQVDRTLEKTSGGLGIGLSLVKGLLAMHGGTIQARSDGEGMGSEFVVCLPVAMDAVTGPSGTSAQAGGVVPSTLRRVLVVDDNVDSADSLGQVLEMLGNEVRTANDGEAALAMAAQFRPDLLLMDIGMPKMNGYEAARRMRGCPWGRDMVLVALTGWGQEDDRQKSAQAGFDHHLVKPVEMHTLTKLLSGLK